MHFSPNLAVRSPGTFLRETSDLFRKMSFLYPRNLTLFHGFYDAFHLFHRVRRPQDGSRKGDATDTSL